MGWLINPPCSTNRTAVSGVKARESFITAVKFPHAAPSQQRLVLTVLVLPAVHWCLVQRQGPTAQAHIPRVTGCGPPTCAKAPLYSSRESPCPHDSKTKQGAGRVSMRLAVHGKVMTYWKAHALTSPHTWASWSLAVSRLPLSWALTGTEKTLRQHLGLEVLLLCPFHFAPLVDCQPHGSLVHVNFRVPEDEVLPLVHYFHCRCNKVHQTTRQVHILCAGLLKGNCLCWTRNVQKPLFTLNSRALMTQTCKFKLWCKETIPCSFRAVKIITPVWSPIKHSAMRDCCCGRPPCRVSTTLTSTTCRVILLSWTNHLVNARREGHQQHFEH